MYLNTAAFVMICVAATEFCPIVLDRATRSDSQFLRVLDERAFVNWSCPTGSMAAGWLAYSAVEEEEEEEGCPDCMPLVPDDGAPFNPSTATTPPAPVTGIVISVTLGLITEGQCATDVPPCATGKCKRPVELKITNNLAVPVTYNFAPGGGNPVSIPVGQFVTRDMTKESDCNTKTTYSFNFTWYTTVVVEGKTQQVLNTATWSTDIGCKECV